jgi:hypothetical protein
VKKFRAHRPAGGKHSTQPVGVSPPPVTGQVFGSKQHPRGQHIPPAIMLCVSSWLQQYTWPDNYCSYVYYSAHTHIDLSRAQQKVGLPCQAEYVGTELKNARIHLHIDTTLEILATENVQADSVEFIVCLDFHRGR